MVYVHTQILETTRTRSSARARALAQYLSRVTEREKDDGKYPEAVRLVRARWLDVSSRLAARPSLTSTKF